VETSEIKTKQTMSVWVKNTVRAKIEYKGKIMELVSEFKYFGNESNCNAHGVYNTEYKH
jgi:hypothetical protein